MKPSFAKFLPRQLKLKPAYIALATCVVLFLFACSRMAYWSREAAPILAELSGDSHGNYDLQAFRKEYMTDPYAKAIGLSQRQLQLCSQIWTIVPAYESAASSRNISLIGAIISIGIVTYPKWGTKLKMKLQSRMAKLRQMAMEEMMRKAAGNASNPFARPQPKAQEKDSSVREAVVNNILSCPSCHKELRVPAGKGRIRVTCSACGNKFETVT